MKEQKFVEVLRGRGLEIRKQAGDGNCLFRAVSEQVYGDPEMHGQVRRLSLEFMVGIRTLVNIT
jgi:OTU domain-containing protein 5